MARPKAQELIQRIDEKRGNISAIARSFGVERATVYRWIENTATAKTALEDARETMIDNAESMLYKKVLEGSTAELIFFLKTQGRHRGYVERAEVTGKDGGALQIEYVNDWRSVPEETT